MQANDNERPDDHSRDDRRCRKENFRQEPNARRQPAVSVLGQVGGREQSKRNGKDDRHTDDESAPDERLRDSAAGLADDRRSPREEVDVDSSHALQDDVTDDEAEREKGKDSGSPQEPGEEAIGYASSRQAT